MIVRGRRWARILFKTLAWIAGVHVALILCLLAFMWHWVAKPPPTPVEAAILRESPRREGEVTHLGKNWLGQRDGLPVLYLTGSSFEMGYANGVLTSDLMHAQEEALIGVFHEMAPSVLLRLLGRVFITFHNRHLPDYVDDAIELEIAGIARGCPDVNPGIGPYYHRLLNYHAAQDISYMMADAALVPGCTGFGAGGEWTADGHLIGGRNFDWEGHPVFDQRRLLVLCEPDEGIPFVSLAWSGMAGCVSGMNREGVAITINGGPSRLPDRTGTPTCLTARKVLQYAHNLDEAVRIIEESRPFVSALFLVGSRRDHAFAIVERTPERTAVRRWDDGLIVCANHFMTPGLAEEPINRRFMTNDTSVARYDRMSELLAEAGRELSPAAAVAVLRDRRLSGGDFAGNGHRNSLNPLIATHSVVFDLTAGVFWAAVPPHQLGSFVAVDVGDFRRALPELALPADPMLVSGEYDRYVASVDLVRRAEASLDGGRWDEAIELAGQADLLNPGLYRHSLLQARAWMGAGDSAHAQSAAQQALNRHPPPGPDRRYLERLMSHNHLSTKD